MIFLTKKNHPNFVAIKIRD